MEDYLAMVQRAPERWNPDPFTNPKGDWQRDHFEEAVKGMESLLNRLKSGEVTEEDLKRSDIKEATRKNTYKYWLYIQHHPPPPRNEWKRLGQRFWSVAAWRSYSERSDRDLALDHVVPKKRMWERLRADSSNVRLWMERNLCCVVTASEHRCLSRTDHPNETEPWRRYEGSGIVLLHSFRWTDLEREPLLRYGLLNHSSFPTLLQEES